MCTCERKRKRKREREKNKEKKEKKEEIDSEDNVVFKVGSKHLMKTVWTSEQVNSVLDNNTTMS